MNSARIFLVGDEKDKLIPMIETEYEKEHVLQGYLARYPDLLPGDQFNPENPRRWLLVAREMGVPSAADEAKHWSLDHLFLDQDGIPTFVECKRSTDTRARREVVAQMLDYAANGLEYWSRDRLRQDAAETARSKGGSIENEIAELIDSSDKVDIENFWKKVEDNLHHGKVRLVFVADETSKELRRLVEFLNEKMEDVEVLAVEVKQFLGGGKTTLVPRVIGLTEASREKKDKSGAKTNCEAFLANCIEEARPVFEKLFEMVLAKGCAIYWGTVGFSMKVYLPNSDKYLPFAEGYPYPADQLRLNIRNLAESSEEAAALRQQFANWQFVDAGESKVKTSLNNRTASNVYKAFDCALDKVAEKVRKDVQE